MQSVTGSPAGGRAPDPIFVLLSVCLATGTMVAFVICISPALTLIQRDLGAGFPELQWVLNGYLLAQCALLVVGGSLGDRLGHRRVFTPAMALFAAGLFLCAAVSSAGALIVLAVILGAVSALALGNALSLVADAFPLERRRSRALAVWGVGLAGFYALAPLFAGFAGQFLSWRATFVLLGALALLSAVAARLRAVDVRAASARALDLPGALLLAVGSGSLVAVLIEGNRLGWTSASLVLLLALGIGALAGLGWWERRSPSPMVDVALLREPVLVAAALATVAMSAGFFAHVVYLPIYFAESLEASPARSVLLLLAVTGTGVVAALAAVWLRGRVPDRLLCVVALSLMTVGSLLSARIEPDWSYARLLPGLVLFGWGLGTFSGPVAALVAGAAGPARSGVANAAVYSCRLIGSTLGIAGFGAILGARIGSGPAAAPAALVAGIGSVFLVLGAVLAVTVLVVAGLLFIPATNGKKRLTRSSIARRSG